MSSLKNQIGGSHYKDMKIQPMEFSMANNLNACQHTVIKYVCRYKFKDGVEDINKAIHTLELLKELEYTDVCKCKQNDKHIYTHVHEMKGPIRP